MADITNESDQFALPSDHGYLPATSSNRPIRADHSVSGDDPLTGAQTLHHLEGFSEPDSFYPDLTKAKNDALKSKQGPLQHR